MSNPDKPERDINPDSEDANHLLDGEREDDSGDLDDSQDDDDSSDSSNPNVPHIKLVKTDNPQAADGTTAANPNPPTVHQVWEVRLLKAGKKGAPRKIFANALVPLRWCLDFKDCLRFNGFSATIEVAKALPWDEVGEFTARPWNEFDVLRYTEWLQKRTIDVSKLAAADAAYTIAKEREYHPVRDWLNSLVWDGVPRLDSFLPVYFGAPDGEYERMVGAKFLISLVARVMMPGCKADCMLILIGSQGQKKSTGVSIVVGKEWFTDEIKAVSGNKDVAISMTGKLLVEFSDLEGFHGRSADELKAFVSRTTDRYRAPFGRYAEDHPRQLVFVGTTNQDTPLKDFTGNRRYWPIKTGDVDTDLLIADRNQLWAEAVARFKHGEAWWLEKPEERALAAKAAEESQEIDLWQQQLEEELEGTNETTMSVVMEEIVGIELKKVTRRDQMRVASALQALGWVRVRGEDPKTKRRYWKYQRAESIIKKTKLIPRS